MRKTRSLADRLWKKVDKSMPMGCWPWLSGTDGRGYGRIQAEGRPHFVMNAHRAVYELVNGPVDRSLVIDHLCHNKACCNPGHLEAVSNRENSRRGVHPPDRKARWGSANGRSKMTDDTVREARQRRANGERNLDLAGEYGISDTAMSQLLRGLTWKHVPLPSPVAPGEAPASE